MDDETERAIIKKVRKAATALQIGPKKVGPGRAPRAPVVDWQDLLVIANLGKFNHSIRKTIKAHDDAGLLSKTCTLDGHRVRIESRMKEIRAAAATNVVAIGRKKK